jgi:hypothetical protein
LLGHSVGEGSVADGLLELFEGTDLYLADTFTGNSVMLAEIRKVGRIIPEPALGEDVAFTVAESRQRVDKKSTALVPLIRVDEVGLLILGIVD